MPEQTETWDKPVPPDAVAESRGGEYWSVSECRWETVAPALPHEVIDLLAPPIEVGAAPWDTDRPAGDPTALDHLDMIIYDPRDAGAMSHVGRHRRTVAVG